jgi:hypothetical protein
MKYIIVLSTREGIMLEETLDLPVEDTISWHDFVQLRLVRDLLLSNPSMEIIDITPAGMPNSYSAEQQLINTLRHQGLRKGQNAMGQTSYEEEDTF